jgi:uncharacterized protein
VVGHNNDI